MNNEFYTDNIPDMSGQSWASNKGRSFVVIKLSAKTKTGKDRYCRVPFRPWSTQPQRRLKSYNYYKIKLDDEFFYVKAPATFPKENLETKVNQFITEEYGRLTSWEFVCKVDASIAQLNNYWSPGF